MRRFTVIMLALLSGLSLRGQEQTVLCGRIVSDFRSPNNALNENISPTQVDILQNACTAYMVTDDGKGYKLVFCSPYDNALERYSRVTLRLDGARVQHLEKPRRTEITGLMATNVVSVEPGSASDVPARVRNIAELSDDDLFTLVTLKDVEFVFKDGAFSNIYESYSLPSPLNSVSDKWKGNGRMDGVACLLCDADNRGIYMNVGTMCQWRREPIPAGRGTVTGVLVCEQMPRQGGYLGPYCIRPVTRKDIAVSNKAKDSSYGVAASWNYTSGSAEYGWMMPDKGDGQMWANSVAKTYLSGDYTSTLITEKDPKGWVANGSVCFEGPVTQWYVWNGDKVRGVNGIYIQCDLSKARSGVAAIDIRACAGMQNGATAHHFPAHWRVSASFDGGAHFETLKDIATGQTFFKLCSLPVWDYKYKGKNIPTSYDMSLGFQEHSFALGEHAGNAAAVIVCISPADVILAAPQTDPSMPSDDGSLKVSADMQDNTVIRFGEITVRYR